MKKFCCFCKRGRPSCTRKAMREGWRGRRILEKGQKSHWCCPLHDNGKFADHVELVADGIQACEVA